MKTYGDEVSLQPSVVLHCVKGCLVFALNVNLAVVNIRVLGGRVVAPNDHIPHIVCWNATAHRHLVVPTRKNIFNFCVNVNGKSQVCQAK